MGYRREAQREFPARGAAAIYLRTLRAESSVRVTQAAEESRTELEQHVGEEVRSEVSTAGRGAVRLFLATLV